MLLIPLCLLEYGWRQLGEVARASDTIITGIFILTHPSQRLSFGSKAFVFRFRPTGDLHRRRLPIRIHARHPPALHRVELAAGGRSRSAIGRILAREESLGIGEGRERFDCAIKQCVSGATIKM